ncbi:MAG: UDP-glucose 4-epimerase GalE [Bacteroidales bacterium]|nr:UDP-glucose 4-epimerase GalE [Bacteroidales bacterium]
MKMKILVTGGTGYIGSHTVVELQNAGFEVVIIDNLSNSYEWIIDRIAQITGTKPEFINIDLTEKKKVNEFFLANNDIQGVVHFAAFKAVGESVSKPLKYYHNNITSLINVLQGMEEAKIKPVVFSSSCTVYGQPDKLPVTEKSPIKKAWSPYGHTKQISEDIIKNGSESIDIEAILLRYFNPIGAHRTSLIGELPIGVPDNLIPYITQTAIGKRDFLYVFGNDYNTPDGTPIRDYIHVVDLAKAHVVAIERLINKKNKKKTEVFNLGTGKGYSVLEVIRSFEIVSGVKLQYRIVERRPGDIEKVWADTSYANNELGWKSELELDEMIDSAWKWEQIMKNK